MINDDDRVRQAVRKGGRMVGPWETDRCKHGRLFSFRWTWPVGSTPEGGDAEMGASGCKACGAE